MKFGVLLSIGGLSGSFLAVLCLMLGMPKLDLLLCSLFFVSAFSILALISEGRVRGFASSGIRSYSRAYRESSLMNSLARVGFGAGLAGAVLAALSQATLKISQVFALDLITASLISLSLFASYLALILILLSITETQRHSR